MKRRQRVKVIATHLTPESGTPIRRSDDKGMTLEALPQMSPEYHSFNSLCCGINMMSIPVIAYLYYPAMGTMLGGEDERNGCDSCR